MLNRLRLNLTLLYIGFALGLLSMVSLGAYSLLGYYFQRQADLALGYKMAITFRQFNIPLPSALQQAEQDWIQGETNGLAFASDRAPTATFISEVALASSNSNEGEDGENEGDKENGNTSHEREESETDEEHERYDARLASIYVISVNSSGRVIQSPGVVTPPYNLDQAAVNGAFANGVDIRTIRLANQEHVRILTYRVDSSEGPYFFQAGRSLADHDRVKTQFLLGLLLLGAVSSAGVGLASWWLSGKSILPAQRTWEQQQTFVSNASHELRTPLTLIRASAEVLHRRANKAGGNVEEARLADDILAECDYMDRLVNDLLLLSRLDTHRLELERKPVWLPDLLDEIAKQAERLTGEKQIRVQVSPVQAAVQGDRQRLRQVLLILLDNAIRYTPPGGEIRLEAVKQEKTCQLILSDNGPGISPEDLPHIFERFYQANPTEEGEGNSNGLGLSIARGLIEAQGGSITIESEPGSGTRAIIILPA